MVTITGTNSVSQNENFKVGYSIVSYQDSITAFAGGGQTSATVLPAQVNRVTTVATAGDSVILPASVGGMEIQVYNDGANALAVFPNGTDTINDQAASGSMLQIPDSLFRYVCSTPGKWECEEAGSGFSGQFPLVSYTNGITAHAGGGQGSAVALTTVINRVTTVATAADSCVLPVSKAGMQVTVTNAAATNSMNLFPASGEQINALGANAAFAIAAGKTATLSCAVSGQWHAVLSA